jgi:hypothetical protein
MPSTGESEEIWSISDVFLLAEGDGSGRVAVPNLKLTIRGEGLELAKTDGEATWRSRWSNLDELSMAEHSVLPDGREGLVMLVVERGGRHHRFILPTDEPLALASRVRQLAHDHRIRTSEPRSPALRSLTVGVVLATMATLAALLLSAAHVIHF